MGSAQKKKRLAVAEKATLTQLHPKESSNNYFLFFLLILAAALLYGDSLKYPLVFDDLPFFVDSDLWQHGYSLFRLDPRWVSYASFGWSYKLFGLDWSWYRLENVVLHGLTGVLLFLFFSRLLNAIRPLQDVVAQSHWPAFFAALVFVLHPAAVYGVAYLVQRSIILATLFGIASLLCYLEGLARGGTKWFLLSALCYFLAVFSKEHSIMIPGVAAALTLLLHKPSFPLIKKVWLPFILYLAIGILVILRSNGVLGTVYEPLANDILSQLSEQQNLDVKHAYGLSVITQGYLFFKYLLLWILPYTGWMSIDIRQPFATHFISWPQLPGFILFLAYPVLAMKWLLKGGRQGLLGLGLLFPWILYLTELSTARIQEPFVLYRSYLWMSGLPIVLFSFMGSLPKKFIPAFLGGFCLMLAILAWNRLDTFSSDLKLWSDAVDKYEGDNLPYAERAFNNRGNAYLNLGEFQKAQEDFKKAATISPKYADAYSNIGGAYFLQKNFPAALESYNTAINLKPDYAKYRINRSTLLLQMGRYGDALKDCEHALQLDAQNTDAYLNCGFALSHMGKRQEALHYLDNALRVNPRLVAAYINRSIINKELGRHDSALGDLDQAASVDPENARIYYDRASLHGILGHYGDAIQDYNKAIALNPEYFEAYINRADAFLKTGRQAEAFNDSNRAAQLRPDSPFSFLNRAAVNSSLGKLQDALNDYDKALTLYGKLLQLDANYTKALFYRGQTLYMLNRKNEAMDSFRKSCNAGNPEACKQLH